MIPYNAIENTIGINWLLKLEQKNHENDKNKLTEKSSDLNICCFPFFYIKKL